MEQIEILLTKLVRLCGGEPDDIVIRAYAKEICQNGDVTCEEHSPKSTYNEVLKEVKDFGRINFRTADKVASVLMGRESLVSLETAKGISQFYDRIPKATIREALERGEIQGSIPPKKEVCFSCEYGTDTHTVTRQQTVASYKFNVKSLIDWLEEHYSCKFSSESIIGRCLKKLREG